MRRPAFTQGCILLSTALLGFLAAPAALADGPRRPEERSAIFRSAPPPRAQRPKALAPRVPQPDVDISGRGRAIERRAVTLLVAEIQQLESLLAVTPPNAPDRPGLVRRIAEDYAELAAAAQRDRIRAEIQLDDLRRATQKR